MFINLNGRISLLYCVYWGIIAVIYLKIAYPALKKLEPMIYKKTVKVFTIILMIVMIFDITISCMQEFRQKNRHKGIRSKYWDRSILRY